MKFHCTKSYVQPVYFLSLGNIFQKKRNNEMSEQKKTAGIGLGLTLAGIDCRLSPVQGLNTNYLIHNFPYANKPNTIDIIISQKINKRRKHAMRLFAKLFVFEMMQIMDLNV